MEKLASGAKFRTLRFLLGNANKLEDSVVGVLEKPLSVLPKQVPSSIWKEPVFTPKVLRHPSRLINFQLRGSMKRDLPEMAGNAVNKFSRMSIRNPDAPLYYAATNYAAPGAVGAGEAAAVIGPKIRRELVGAVAEHIKKIKPESYPVRGLL